MLGPGRSCSPTVMRTRFSLEFTLIPTTKVPGFDDWLADRDAAALP